MTPHPPIYYDTLRQLYWMQNNRGGWIQVNNGSLKRQLRAQGFQAYPGGPLELEMNRIETENDVVYAGALAGYKSGMIEQCGYRVLVTSEPKIIRPEPGGCPLVLKLIDNLFGSQAPYVYGWLKVADESLRSGSFRPGQALVIVGPAGSGKSLFQNLITHLFGGRAAKPYKYMSGATTFNGDLFTAEHLMIEDEVSSTNSAKRHHFGTEIKAITVNETQGCHGKGKQIITLKPFWRLSITTNEDNITILPPMGEDLVDKFILTKATKLPMPMPTNTLEQRKAFMGGLLAELPAFIYFLQGWKIPPTLQCERFGVSSYQHPELMDDLNELAPETRLLAMIDGHLFNKESIYLTNGWKGTSDKLENSLRQSSYSAEVSYLLNWENAVGVYLGKLAAKYPKRFTQSRKTGKRIWTIEAGR